MWELASIFALGFVGGVAFMFAIMPGSGHSIEQDPTEHGGHPL